jgi:hypothetical protein
MDTADGFLNLYKNLTGVDIQPPDYVPPTDTGTDPTGGDTGGDTGGIQVDATGGDTGIDLTDVLNLLNQLQR